MADKKPDPRAHLPRGGLSRRYAVVDEMPKPVAKRIEAAMAAVEAMDLPKPAKSKRGRPVAPKPWEAEGVSRMTWHRRQKGKL